MASASPAVSVSGSAGVGIGGGAGGGDMVGTAPGGKGKAAGSAPKESAVARLLIAPLTFLSFLLSLALIDARNDRLRRKFHPRPNSPSHSTSHSPSRSESTSQETFLEKSTSWIWKPKEENPYGWVGTGNGKEGEKGEWHWRTKQREMMRMEVVEAFELRERVVFALVGGMVVLMAGVGWVWLGRW